MGRAFNTKYLSKLFVRYYHTFNPDWLGTDRMMQVFTLQGIPEDRLKRPSKQADKQKDMAAYRCNTVNEMLSLYLSCNNFLSINNVTTVSKGFPVKTPYPRIFVPYVGGRFEHLGVESVPILAGLHSGASVGDMIENLHTEAKKLKFARFHQFIGAGLEFQELTECYLIGYLISENVTKKIITFNNFKIFINVL